MTSYKLSELPYKLEDLEPGVSRETLQYHYNKHHAGYVTKLNGLVEGTKLAEKTLEELIKSEKSGAVFNNAAQIWNHSFYWNSMTPNRDIRPSAKVTDSLNKHFGSLEKFTSEFATVATGQFGSGWAWLVQDKAGALKVMSTSNAESPLQQGLQPLLVCDVWEHAYYIDYRNDRSTYIEKFIGLINWEFVEANLVSSIAPQDQVSSTESSNIASTG